jgi:transposase, IS30 family
MMPYEHLNLCDRKVIKKMIREHKSIREISIYLGRHPSTVSREIRRNKDDFWYHPVHADEKYQKRRKESKVSILDSNREIKEHIVQELKDRKSPDVISGRLKLTHKNRPDMQISHESIYRWIYKEARKGEPIYKYLPRGIKKRQKRLNSKRSRIQIPDRVSIHARPESTEKRRDKGHWEGDTITGKNHQGYISTLVERKTYFLAAGLMSDKRPETCNRSILEAFGDIHNKLIKSITLDNGSEFYQHKILQESLECRIYFADPYSVWQRGINEHTNGLLRKYFTKKMNFKELTQNDVDEVVKKLNNTPRKSLGYRTPYEVFYNVPVALQT